MNNQKLKYGECHQFNVGVAQKYGVEEAIIIHNLHHWIEKNEANEKHFHDGKYWTYNSVKAFSALFPYWNAKHIARLLTKMEQDGTILTGNFNKNPYDRTKWYALPESVLSIYQKWEMENPNPSNGFSESVPPIPNSKPDINTDSKPVNKEKEESDRIVDVSCHESCHESYHESSEDKSSESSTTQTPYKQIANLYASICVSYPRLAKLSDARKKAIHARLNDGYKFEDFKHLFEMAENSSFLKGQNNRRWHATFDWLIKESNMAKVLEGNYANDKNQISTNSSASAGHTGEKKGWGGYLC